jgi:serine protease Do
MKFTFFLCAAIALAQTAPRVAKTPQPQTSYLGVNISEIDADRAKALRLPSESGVEISRVEQDSPAERAGLRVGDAVTQYNGQRVEGMEQFSRMVRETPVGREVKLEIVRNGTPQWLAVKVGGRPMTATWTTPAPPAERFELRMPDMPRSFMSWRSSALGIECETLEGQLAQYFGVKEGVLVRSVNKNSAGEKAGIKAGDVITRADDAHIATPADLSSRIRSAHGKTVPLTIMRDRKEMNITVSVEDEDRGGDWFFQQNAPRARD